MKFTPAEEQGMELSGVTILVERRVNVALVTRECLSATHRSSPNVLRRYRQQCHQAG